MKLVTMSYRKMYFFNLCTKMLSVFLFLELQKFVGSMFFGVDLEMYDPGTNERAKANTSDLNEELGQVYTA